MKLEHTDWIHVSEDKVLCKSEKTGKVCRTVDPRFPMLIVTKC